MDSMKNELSRCNRLIPKLGRVPPLECYTFMTVEGGQYHANVKELIMRHDSKLVERSGAGITTPFPLNFRH